MMTMKQACEYVKNSRIEKAKKHRAMYSDGRYCSGLTDKEYKLVHVRGKGAGSKGRAYSHTKLWSDSKHSNGIRTLYYDGSLTV